MSLYVFVYLEKLSGQVICVYSRACKIVYFLCIHVELYMCMHVKFLYMNVRVKL